MYLNDLLLIFAGLSVIPAVVLSILAGALGDPDMGGSTQRRSFRGVLALAILIWMIAFSLAISAVWVAYSAPHTTGGTP